MEGRVALGSRQVLASGRLLALFDLNARGCQALHSSLVYGQVQILLHLFNDQIHFALEQVSTGMGQGEDIDLLSDLFLYLVFGILPLSLALFHSVQVLFGFGQEVKAVPCSAGLGGVFHLV